MVVHVGTSGFSFASWRTQVYPYALKSSEMFDYYCQRLGFDSLEINSSFYQMPYPRSMASLARRSPVNFKFIAKLHHGFTHNTDQATAENFDQFKRGIAPLVEAGKLKGLLAQFPESFVPTRQNAEWLKRLRDEMQQAPLFVEFRHRRWVQPRVLQFLRQEGLGYCVPDLPAVGALPSFVPAATSGTAYVRLHGRNREWYSPSTSRYDYQYSDTELQDIYGRTSEIMPAPLEVFFFFNNCHGAAAVRSAKRMIALTLNQVQPSLNTAIIN